jgi:hypothetical protein
VHAGRFAALITDTKHGSFSVNQPEPCQFAADVDCPPDRIATEVAWTVWLAGLAVVAVGLLAALAMGFLIGLSLR